MAMMLKSPKGQPWLDVDEVIRRMRSEFTQVVVSTEGVGEHVDHLASRYRDQGHGDLASRLEVVKGKAAWVVVMGGDPESHLPLMVIPEFPIMSGFSSEAHLEKIQPLLERCSKALGYELR